MNAQSDQINVVGVTGCHGRLIVADKATSSAFNLRDAGNLGIDFFQQTLMRGDDAKIEYGEQKIDGEANELLGFLERPVHIDDAAQEGQVDGDEKAPLHVDAAGDRLGKVHQFVKRHLRFPFFIPGAKSCAGFIQNSPTKIGRQMFKKLCLALAAWLSLSAHAVAAQEATLLDRMMKEDSAAVNAVVGYPADVRQAIFTAATRPDALIHIANLQERSKREFSAILNWVELDTQKKLWELSRYPDLVNFLATGKVEKAVLDAELAKYPLVIHAMVRDLYLTERGRIMQMAELNKASAEAFASLLVGYDAPVQAALKQLLDLPEVLAILTEHVDLTAEVGRAYAKNPEAFVAKADALSLKLARDRAEAEAEWLESLKSDPVAMAEFEKSAKDYEHEMALNDASYVYKADPKVNVTVTYHVYPYSYWYGYPTWYGSPYWYPYPHWYHAGFYIGPNGAVIIVGTPSYHFTYWHFHGRHYAYPHLSHHFARHYKRHPHGGGVADAVQDWADNNRDRLPRDWSKRQPQTGADFFKNLPREQGAAVPQPIKEKDWKRDWKFEKRQPTSAERRFEAKETHARAWKKSDNRKRGGERKSRRN